MIQEFYTPYPHFETCSLFDENDLDKILKSLRLSNQWSLHSESFFSQYEDTTSPIENKDLLEIFTIQKISEIISLFENFFCIKLDRNKFKIVSHKIVSGQSIGLHNDAPYDGLETHRFILTFSENYKDSFGGHFLMFRGNRLSDISKIFRPTNGLGIGISLSEISYHAVNMVNDWERYSIVFSFWENDFYPKKHSRIIELKHSGASEFKHSNRNLFTHLLNTYQILQSWGCSEHVSLAGLYHSIYGTSRIEIPNLKKDFHEIIDNSLKVEVKELIDSYSRAKSSEIIKEIENLKKDRRNKGKDFLKLIDLLLIDMANTIDQSELFNDKQFREDLNQYLPIAEFLPDKVQRILAGMN